jgi:hypothetical protein
MLAQALRVRFRHNKDYSYRSRVVNPISILQIVSLLERDNFIVIVEDNRIILCFIIIIICESV